MLNNYNTYFTSMIKAYLNDKNYLSDLKNSTMHIYIEDKLNKNERINIDDFITANINYYTSIFSVILSTSKPCCSLTTIFRSLEPEKKNIFYFFINEILAQENPKSIINCPLKTLILSILKKEV